MFTQRALKLLQDGKHDELQTELSKLEEAWRFVNEVRASLEQANHGLIEAAGELALAGQRVVDEKRQVITDSQTAQAFLSQQIANVQTNKAGQLEQLVAQNVELQNKVKELTRALEELGRSGDAELHQRNQELAGENRRLRMVLRQKEAAVEVQ
jgi:dynactin complex subunit